jgi:basic membrane protein A and related proteins
LVKKTIQLAAGFAAVALAAAACGSKPVTTSSAAPSGSSGAATAAAFHACMVTDTGGIDDHSFNSAAWAGMQEAHSMSSNIAVRYVQSATENDYATNITGFAGTGGNCNLIVTVGGLMADATTAGSKKYAGQKFAIVDSGSVAPDIKGLQFNTAQGAFLGGYLAAGMTKTGKVATYGGENIPPVTVYMDGFWEGVQYYNQQHSTKVEVLGWNEKTQQGVFDSSANPFSDENGGKAITQTFAEQGADIVFPVAGGTGIGTLAAAQASNGSLNAIWVDTDGCASNPTYCDVIISSVLKGIAAAVSTTVEQAAAGNYNTTSYIGTLSNNGTALGSYNDWASKVPAALTAEIATVKAAIIAGTIKITSKSQPTS